MFPSGSSKMNPRTRQLLSKIATVVKKMPNHIAIAGHTDSHKFSTGGGYTNWELSVDRANASRRALIDAKLDEARINRVMGKADQEHLFKNDPFDPRNRRISIILLKDEISGRDTSKDPLPDDFKSQVPDDLLQQNPYR